MKLPSATYQELLGRAMQMTDDPERLARMLLSALVESRAGDFPELRTLALFVPDAKLPDSEPQLRLVGA